VRGGRGNSYPTLRIAAHNVLTIFLVSELDAVQSGDGAGAKAFRSLGRRLQWIVLRPEGLGDDSDNDGCAPQGNATTSLGDDVRTGAPAAGAPFFT
jgi:hypothetical protein